MQELTYPIESSTRSHLVIYRSTAVNPSNSPEAVGENPVTQLNPFGEAMQCPVPLLLHEG